MSKVPPVPQDSKPRKGPKSPYAKAVDPQDMEDHKHHNIDEQGQTANIKQNTTNAGFFKGRRTK